jgi:hypothetical protein
VIEPEIKLSENPVCSENGSCNPENCPKNGQNQKEEQEKSETDENNG